RPRRAAQGRRNRVLARRPAVALLPPSQQPEADQGGTRLIQRDRNRRTAARSPPSRQQSQERLPTFGAIPEKEADITGSALIDFVIALIVICGTGALFFLTIDRVAPDALLNKIAKIAIGIVLAVVILLAVKSLLFGGGGGPVVSAGGIIGFAIGVIVILVLLFLIDMVLKWLGTQMGDWLISIIRYLVFAVALIALLVLADRTLFSGHY